MSKELESEEEESSNTLSEQERALRQTTFRVMRNCCANCLFGPHKLVSDERKEALLEGIVGEENFFLCHEASERGQTVCCRAFYERYKDRLLSLQLAQFYDRVYPGSLRFVTYDELLC